MDWVIRAGCAAHGAGSPSVTELPEVVSLALGGRETGWLRVAFTFIFNNYWVESHMYTVRGAMKGTLMRI